MTNRVSRVGLIVPSSNTVMEPDFHRRLGASAVLSTTRIFLEHVTREAETRMLEQDLLVAARMIMTTAPDIVVFGCTSAGALGTLQHDRAIGEKIEKETGAHAITVISAVIAQLREIQPRRLAVFTPYVDDLTRGVASSLAEAGFPPVRAAGMGIESNLAIGRVTPSQIVTFVESHMNGLDSDCVFLSCTNLQAVDAIGPLAQKLGRPVISSNQATIDLVRSSIEASGSARGYIAGG